MLWVLITPHSGCNEYPHHIFKTKMIVPHLQHNTFFFQDENKSAECRRRKTNSGHRLNFNMDWLENDHGLFVKRRSVKMDIPMKLCFVLCVRNGIQKVLMEVQYGTL